MAYVGTPRYLGSDQATLASIIYGEAGNQGTVGMQAVGAVIANRAAAGNFGSGIMGVALARNQFQGQSTNYNMTAWNVAGAVLNGTNPDPTGGALYYANPGASSASWARNLNSGNALQIGDHFFTDNTNGVPFTPNVTGSGSTIATGPPDTSSGGSTTNPDGSVGGELFPGSGITGTLSGEPSGTGGSTSTGSGSSTSGDVGQGTPVTQGLQQGTLDAIGKWIGNIESAFGSGLKSALTAGENAVGTFFGGVENWFIRAGLIVLAIILIAIGLLILLWDHGGKETAGQVVKLAAA